MNDEHKHRHIYRYFGKVLTPQELRDTVTIKEIADRLDRHIGTVSHWKNSEKEFPFGRFPQPILAANYGRKYYSWPEVKQWYDDNLESS